jgi:AcrR family transcriptional regulator
MVMSPGRTDRGAKRLPATERRQQLLDVALRLFATKGYTATTMDDIADAAGVTKPLLYQHFDSKRALYMELVEAVASAMRAAIGDATSRATSPRQQVEGGFSAYFELVVSQAHAFQLLFGSNTPEDDETALMLRHVEDVMTKDVASVPENAGIDQVVELMEQRGIRRVPVMRGDVVVGIISRADLIRVIGEALGARTDAKRDDPAIREALLGELKKQNWFGAQSVSIMVESGTVTLEGVLFDDAARAALVVAAENVPGVKSVIDKTTFVEPVPFVG